MGLSSSPLVTSASQYKPSLRPGVLARRCANLRTSVLSRGAAAYLRCASPYEAIVFGAQQPVLFGRLGEAQAERAALGLVGGDHHGAVVAADDVDDRCLVV